MNIFKEKILCSAMKIMISESYIIVQGKRHFNCFNKCLALGIDPDQNKDSILEGFITSKGRFVDRIEAKKIARKAKQLIRNTVFPELISEDIFI